MIDLEKLRIDYERKVKEAEVANAIEQETGIEPSVFTMQGRLHVYFGKIKSESLEYVMKRCEILGDYKVLIMIEYSNAEDFLLTVQVGGNE